jgi:light-regulated signal transduction histidine kinase (bacteriophytochrome)/CheY-like chemotaxis protein
MNASPRHQVDLTNCDREPIHLLGAVQPFGFFIAVANADWSIHSASPNVSQWLNATPAELFGQSLDRIFAGEAIHTIRGNLESAVLGDTTARMFGLELARGLVCDVAVHLVGDSVIIECEPSLDEFSFDSAATVRGMMARLQQADGDRNFFRVAAREMRALTGFDRVMVYRFDEDGSGEVIAESAGSGIDSYLGLRYPASDIPRQARALYVRNWLRIIPDVNAEPLAIEQSSDRRGKPLDLSMSVLRSVSAIHIEYLQNMGVRASMSVSILRDGLWGLFACHHYSPRPIGFGRRTAAELFGQMFSLMMENRERAAEATYEARAQTLHQRLVTVMASEGHEIESIVAHMDEISDLLACDGLGLWIEGRAVMKGRTPNAAQFAQLVQHLDGMSLSEVYSRNEIGAEYPQGAEFAEQAAGMLVIPLSKPARNYLIFFREEVGHQVKWAGDPNKPVVAGPHGDRLTPRKSFELWRENVRGQSVPWTPVECRIAEALRVSLLEVILRLSDATAEERRRNEQRRDLLVAELNHRVRNILSLIRGVISQSKGAAQTVESFTRVVGGRIQALARAHDQITADNWGPASFRALVLAEGGAYLGTNVRRLAITGPDALLLPEAFTTVALVMHEMVTNSVKYGALSQDRGRVEIETAFDRLGRFTIDWNELDGPPVKAPTRRGFGSTVIERSIVHDLKGETNIDFALSGLRANFVIPASYVSASSEPNTRSGAGTDDLATTLSVPKDVLLVEDNMIIALDAEEMLRKIGVNSVRIARGIDEAKQLIEQQAPDFALLDVNLGNETSFEIAATLRGRGLPFAFASGYGEVKSLSSDFPDAQSVQKPYTLEILQSLFARSS